MSLLSFASKINWTGSDVSVAFRDWTGQQIVHSDSVSEITIFYPSNKIPTGIVITDANDSPITPSYVNESYKNDSATGRRMLLIGFPGPIKPKIMMTLQDR